MKKIDTTHQFWKLTGIFLETFLSKNIVLVQAIGLCPIIAAGTTLQYGVVLAICTAAVLIPTSLMMSLVGDKLPAWLRPPVYTVGASLLLLLAAFIVDRAISHEIYAYLYLCLPLMAENTIFTYRAGGFSVSNRPAAAVIDAVGSSLGFALVICLASALREMAAGKPASREAMLGIAGVGERKLAQYGDAFLAVIARYVAEGGRTP